MDPLTRIHTKALHIFKEQKIRSNVAILFADMTASSYMNRQPNTLDAWRNILLHNELCREKITKYGGIVIKYIGDGVMGRFNLGEKNVSVDNVLQCAIEIQQEANEISFFSTKIGINICKEGEAIEITKDDLIGSPVDVAARINEMAKPDQILVSENVVEIAKDSQKFPQNLFSTPVKKNIRGMDIKINIYELGWEIKNKPFKSFKGIDTDDKIKIIENIQGSIISIKEDISKTLNEKIEYITNFNNFNVMNILPPSSSEGGNKTKNFIDSYISDYLKGTKKKKKIRAYGIALRRLFQPDGVFKTIILETYYQKKDQVLEFQAIILDPNSDAAKTRSLVEGASDCNDEVKTQECTVYRDIINSISTILHLNDHFPPEQFKVKISKFLPQMWFLMTEDVLFFEQYHIGRSDETQSYKCLGGSVPIIQIGNKSDWYKYFNNQFEFLWKISENDPLNKYFGIRELNSGLAKIFIQDSVQDSV